MKLREMRTLRSFSQERLAEISGVSRSTIAKLELGTQVDTKIATICKICDVLNCTIGDLLGEEENV